MPAKITLRLTGASLMALEHLFATAPETAPHHVPLLLGRVAGTKLPALCALEITAHDARLVEGYLTAIGVERPGTYYGQSTIAELRGAWHAAMEKSRSAG